MPELVVCYDPAREIAAIVNVDERMGWGPAMVGPNAGTILQTFLDTVPFDVGDLGSYEASRAFTSFLDRVALAGEAAGAQADPAPPVAGGSPSVDATAAAAEAEAHNAGDVPPPQPADTDTPASESATAEVRTCPNCQGAGTIQMGDPPVAQACPMCKGAKTVTVQA